VFRKLCNIFNAANPQNLRLTHIAGTLLHAAC